MSAFTNRYCAFIDILGFKARVQQLEKNWDADSYDRLRSCLRFMDEETRESAYSADLPIYDLKDGLLIESELGDPRLTYVSDCIVISTERTHEGFKAICRKATKIWIDLLWDGYLCRGAISGGPLIHEGPFLMGSAYMDAYRCEQDAGTPRVIIDPNLGEVQKTFPNVFPARPPTMERAGDGLLYLRYFPFNFYPPYAPTWTDFLLRARQHIRKGLASDDDAIRRKYQFAQEELNFCIRIYQDRLDPALTERT